MRPVVLAALTCAWASLLCVTPAWADGSSSASASATETQAHQAYARGTAAYHRKDYATAAREYAAADALSPNPVALQAAIDATVQADDAVLGVALVERARGVPRTDALVSTMLVAQQKFAHRTGRISIHCPAQPCLATVDGAATDPSLPAVVLVGAHTVLVESAGATTTRSVTVPPDETVVVAPAPPAAGASGSQPPSASAAASASAPPRPAPGGVGPAPVTPAPPPPPTDHDGSGVSPLWFIVGAGATAVAGGLAIASGIDTASKSSSFSPCRSGDGSTPAPSGCGALASSGQSAQTRTDVLIGITAALGVATALAVPFVRWHGIKAAVTAGGVAFDARF